MKLKTHLSDPRWAQEDVGNLNKPVTSNTFDALPKNLLAKKFKSSWIQH